jgi:FkbM family methyltransferase
VSNPVTTPTTDDAFLGGALQMLQPQNSYRAGLDAVLLAAAASILPGAGARVLDVGAGVGVVGLAVARRVADAHVTLVERDPQLAALACANIARNQLADRASLIEADVSRPWASCRSSALWSTVSTARWPIRPTTRRVAARRPATPSRPAPMPCRTAISIAGPAS